MFSNKILSQINIKEKNYNHISKTYIDDNDFFWLLSFYFM